MRKRMGLLVLMVLVAVTAWGQAEFSQVNGKVEVRPAGGGQWVAAKVGMELDNATMISTGFNASATVALGSSTVSIEQLTRMVFEDIVEQSDSVETRLNLNVGRVSAKVRSSDGRRQDFQVRSPISTAAVRGTDFSFDGEQLEVSDGQVAFVNNYGQRRFVSRGQKSTTDDTPGGPSDPSGEAQEENSTDTGPIGAGSDDEKDGPTGQGPAGPQGPRSTRGSVRVEVR